MPGTFPDEMPSLPDYYPCDLSVLYPALRRLGLDIRPSLLPNLALQSIPVYTRCMVGNCALPRVNTGDTWYLAETDVLSSALGVAIETGEYPDLTGGLNRLQEILAHGEPVLVAGSAYFLPYTPHYRNDLYVNQYPGDAGVVNHWLLLLGYHGGSYQVYDSVPYKYVGPMSDADFSQFWLGDRGIDALATFPGVDALLCRGYKRIRIQRQSDRQQLLELSLRTLRTVSLLYVTGASRTRQGTACVFGRTAGVCFAKDFKEAASDRASQPVLQVYSRCLLSMCMQRTLVLDLLRDVRDTVETPLDGELQAFQHLITQWEWLQNLIGLVVRRRNVDYDRLIALADQIAVNVEAEEHIFARLLSTLQSSGFEGAPLVAL